MTGRATDREAARQRLAEALARHPAVRRAEVRADAGAVHVTAAVEPGWSAVVDGHPRVRVPNGLRLVQQRDYETRYLYQEIFVDHCYLQHGVHLPEGALVLDVGANIGMFALYVAAVCPTAIVHSFEPAPELAELLRINLALYAPNVRSYNYGIGDTDGKREFTFYPNSSVFSGFRTDRDGDRSAVAAVIESTAEGEDLPTFLVDQLMESRLDSVSYPATMRSLSSLFAELGLERVDLLKVDAERSELDVLAGLSEADWDRVRQIVLESHDGPDQHQYIRTLLEARGFTVSMDDLPSLRDAGFVNVYGTRADAEGRPSGPPVPDVSVLKESGVFGHDEVVSLARDCGVPAELPVRVELVEDRGSLERGSPAGA